MLVYLCTYGNIRSFVAVIEDTIEDAGIVVQQLRSFDVLQVVIKVFTQIQLRKFLVQPSHFLQQPSELLDLQNIICLVAGQSQILIVILDILIK